MEDTLALEGIWSGWRYLLKGQRSRMEKCYCK